MFVSLRDRRRGEGVVLTVATTARGGRSAGRESSEEHGDDPSRRRPSHLGGHRALEGLDRPLREVDIDTLQGRSHIVALVKTAWLLGGRPSLAKLKLREHAHGLGFGGHWHTKSRHYSTTFTRLRRARPEYTRRRRAEDGILLDAWGRPEDEEAVVVIKEWRYVGSGYQSGGERWLALSAAAWAREGRRLAREDRYCTPKVA
ncbi:MAG: replication initiator [Actinomycetota bacterium]